MASSCGQGGRRPRALTVLGLALWLLLPGCSAREAEAHPLAGYTDPGDACRQAVVAISYAELLLKPLGQEPYQDYESAVLGRLAAVAGTLALEAEDWPDRSTRRQAEVLQPLAEAAAAPDQQDRARALLDYRVEAARMVQVCRQVTPG